MFKKHSMQIKMVKDQDSNVPNAIFDVDPDKINQIVRESTKTVAIGIVAVAGSLTILKTASQIVINICPKN